MLIDGKIYGDFVQWGAETGRFSSRNPNLQNIPNPKASENGKDIRNLFYAPEGYKLVVADYSQIEPRVLAAMSQDPILLGTYTTPGEKGDVYKAIGDTMNVSRDTGKVLVLAMMYGVGPDKIARSIGCSVTDAKKLLTSFSDKFPTVNTYKSKVVGLARKKGYITTILKRRRYLPDITSKVVGFRAGAERQAFNTRIQGSAADIIKLAMIRAHDMIPKEAKLILTVHDELVTITPDHLVETTREAIRSAMEDIKLLPIPLIADITVVQKWGEAK
jgi:DNA polymerase-1